MTTACGLQSFATFSVIDPQGTVARRSDGEQPDAKLLGDVRGVHTKAAAS